MITITTNEYNIIIDNLNTIALTKKSCTADFLQEGPSQGNH